jgi:hypothetical protein
MAAALVSAAVACGDDDAVTTGTGGSGAQAGGGQGPGGGGQGGVGDTCGNSVVDAGEACDGSDLGGATCVSLGFGPGTLSCGDDCSFDTSQCSAPPNCGDGVIDLGEQCDGNNLGGATCESQGFDSGDIACDARCQLDTSGCCAHACEENETRCFTDAVETCELGANGCLDWVVSDDCAASELVCNPDTTTCALAGAHCSVAIDTTSLTMPYKFAGTFDEDPAVSGSCYSGDATNAVWFTYTATTSGKHIIDALNASTTPAYSRLVLFEGSSCEPLGNELACAAMMSKGIGFEADLTAGETYLILFHTDGEPYTMVEPTLYIAPAGPGETCELAVDLTGASFPVTTSGTFYGDPNVVDSCTGTPTNTFWFSYTAPSDDPVSVVAQNLSTMTASSRLAIFEGTSCDPIGSEVSCTTASSKTISTGLVPTSGSTYLFAFYTNGPTWTMVDPTVSIIPAGPEGNDCSLPLPLASGIYTWYNATHNFSTAGSSGCTGYAANGVDRVHVVTLAAGETLTVTLTPSAGDPSIYLLTDCNDSAGSCVAGADNTGSGQPETLVYTSVAGGTYYFVADRWSSGTTSATYTLDVDIQ